MDIAEYKELKKKIQGIEREKVVAETKMQTAMQRLKEEFGVSTIEEAQDLLEEKENKLAKLQTKGRELMDDLKTMTEDMVCL